jgi:hypothetical protein
MLRICPGKGKAILKYLWIESFGRLANEAATTEAISVRGVV